MMVFSVEISTADIAAYMASHFLPEYFENMKLEKIVFDPAALNWNGTQPLILTYSVPGRVEDFEMKPEEHAFPLLCSVHPFFQTAKAAFIPNSSLWTWDEEKMRILFTAKELQTEPSGEVFSTEDAYVSVSRRRIFISFEVLQEYLAAQFAEIGLEMGPDSPMRWDDSIGGLIYRAGSVTIQWILSEADALDDVLRFLGLDLMLGQIRSWVNPTVETSQIAAACVTEKGLLIPLTALEVLQS